MRGQHSRAHVGTEGEHVRDGAATRVFPWTYSMSRAGEPSFIRSGAVEFQPPRGRVRTRGRLWFNSLYFLVLGVWAVLGSWHQHMILGLVAGLVYLELTLAVFRMSTSVGGVVYSEELAARIAPLLEDLCARAKCALPRVVIRDDAVRAACVRKSRGRVWLVLSRHFVDSIDDRQLGAVMAHEVVHITRDDFKSVKARMWVSLIFAAAGGIALGIAAGGELVLPVYGAAGIVAVMAANVGLSTFNRRLERRADIEGASLCGGPIALASALAVANEFSEQARRRIFGPRPWRWILSPLSWRMPTHPPMSERILRLRDLAETGPPVGARDPSAALPGVAL